MYKSKIFHFLADKADSQTEFLQLRNEHDKEIIQFIEQLSEDGNTFINMNSVAYGRYEESCRIRTIIVYIENPTRKVIFEKTKINDKE